MILKDIEIKRVEAKEVAISTKKTLNTCIWWNTNGVMFANDPAEDKRYQENYTIGMSNHAERICLYSFDIEVPSFKP
jgi:hypothetical protein